jgi:hypothetical protein
MLEMRASYPERGNLLRWPISSHPHGTDCKQVTVIHGSATVSLQTHVADRSTLRYRLLIQKLIVVQVVRKIQSWLEPECSLPCYMGRRLYITLCQWFLTLLGMSPSKFNQKTKNRKSWSSSCFVLWKFVIKSPPEDLPTRINCSWFYSVPPNKFRHSA